MNKLSVFFQNKWVRNIEAALLIAASYFLIVSVGLPDDIIQGIVVSLATALGVDSVATVVSTFKNKKDQ